MGVPPDLQSPTLQNEPSDEQPKKKPWTDPKLVRYGDIEQITLSVGTMGNLDAMGLSMQAMMMGMAPMSGMIRTR